MSQCWCCRLCAPCRQARANPRRRRRRHEERRPSAPSSNPPPSDLQDGVLMEAGARARRLPLGAAWLQALKLTAADYVALTKPRVISLLLVTTAATMFVADPSPD